MMNGNSVMIVGNLVSDLDLRVSEKGNHWALGAVARSYSIGEDAKHTDFFDFKILSGSLAKNAAASLKKGNRVAITGHLSQDKWETSEGGKRSKVVIVATSIAPDLTWAEASVTKNPFDGEAPVTAGPPQADGEAEFSEEPF
ncbi:MAG: single-stranded DNA-binding protein [Chloroflexi bacterium]|nr:single-stranded DNA-binding protein [Chloroflexota bacterium]